MLLVVYLLSVESKQSVAYFIFGGYLRGRCLMEEFAQIATTSRARGFFCGGS